MLLLPGKPCQPGGVEGHKNSLWACSLGITRQFLKNIQLQCFKNKVCISLLAPASYIRNVGHHPHSCHHAGERGTESGGRKYYNVLFLKCSFPFLFVKHLPGCCKFGFKSGSSQSLPVHGCFSGQTNDSNVLLHHFPRHLVSLFPSLYIFIELKFTDSKMYTS